MTFAKFVIFICIAVFVGMSLYIYNHDSKPETFSHYTVIGKTSGMNSIETYNKGSGTSKETQFGNWIAKKWDDGKIEYVFIENPFIAETYKIGNTYVGYSNHYGYFGYVLLFFTTLVLSGMLFTIGIVLEYIFS